MRLSGTDAVIHKSHIYTSIKKDKKNDRDVENNTNLTPRKFICEFINTLSDFRSLESFRESI